MSHPAQKVPCGETAHFDSRLAYGSDRRDEQREVLDIVKSRYRDILWH